MSYQIEILASSSGNKDGVLEVTTSLLEDYFNVSRKTITQWEQKGCPKLSRGKWDLIAILKWRGGLQAYPCEDSEDSCSAALRKIKADTFLKEQQGQIAEIELQKLRKEVVDISDVKRLIGGIILNTKGLLQALPSKVAPKLLGLSALDDLKVGILDRQDSLCKAKTEEDVTVIIGEIFAEFYEAKSLVEINEVLSVLIYEALEDLAGLSIETFEGDFAE